MNSLLSRWRIVAVAVCCVALSASCARDARTRVSPAQLAPAAYGYVDVQCKTDEYTVLLGNRSSQVILTQQENPGKVPKGKYAVLACVARSKDADGVLWQAASQAGTRGMDVQVKPGSTAALKCGPPLTAKLLAEKSGGAVTFGFVLRDAAGLTYAARDITKAGRGGSAPGVAIRDESGAVVAQGTFKYG